MQLSELIIQLNAIKCECDMTLFPHQSHLPHIMSNAHVMHICNIIHMYAL